MAPVGSNKPVALQMTLVAFVLLTLVFGIMAYMFHRQFQDQQAAKGEAEKKMKDVTTLYQNSTKDITALKQLIGVLVDRIEDPSAPDATGTVRGEVQALLNKVGANKGTDLVKTVEKIQGAYAETDTNRKELAKQLSDQNEELLAQRSRYDQIAQEHDKAKQAAEKEKQDVIRNQNEIVAGKDREIAALKKDFNDAVAENANLTEQREKERKKFADEIARLEGINDKIREELDELKQVSFEVADGEIRRVDNASRLVWINKGSADHIRPRITFSVYGKDNSGIGRSQEEIKAKIEVTRVIDAHMSEAKVIEEDLYRPMAPGDVIYSPLWNSGRTEQFSFVGLLDIDRDGRSDRDLIHQIVETAGAMVDNEVDDEGNRTPEGTFINERTKFLVLGDIPDPSTIARPEDRQKAEALMNHLKDMRKEARLSGVRIISLNDFLAYIGYKPKRRLFQPGQERPYNLKAGAHSLSTDETIDHNRDSTGNVSGAVNKKSYKKQEVSPGETSKLFGPKK